MVRTSNSPEVAALSKHESITRIPRATPASRSEIRGTQLRETGTSSHPRYPWEPAVLTPPHLDQDLCFRERVEDLAAQSLVAELAGEALAEPVLPAGSPQAFEVAPPSLARPPSAPTRSLRMSIVSPVTHRVTDDGHRGPGRRASTGFGSRTVRTAPLPRSRRDRIPVGGVACTGRPGARRHPAGGAGPALLRTAIRSPADGGGPGSGRQARCTRLSQLSCFDCVPANPPLA